MFAIAIQPVEAKKDGYYKDQQKARVKDGIRDGSLTPREVEKLRKKQAQINAQRAQFRSTGDGLTEREREKFSGTSKATSASRSI
ncbi:MAG: hypothetical protein K8F91_10170, partial [Candidatus Obscuribacterales bacterium]|nr:hypothetical protein [Candidatus Obscuribacterales bacterium]